MKKRIVVAMSGGVDSSVAAALVTRAGHEAIGVTLKLMPKLESSFGCCGSPRDVDDAKRVCETLKIPHYVLDMSDLFEKKVITHFVDNYLNSRTPNPCVECNRSVKFGYLLGLVDAWKAHCVATGHYARVENGKLLKAKDEQKDQTYFLHSLTRNVLERVMFPVGDLEKPQVREIARSLGLATAEKPESQEICFVPNRDYRTFVRAKAEETGVTGKIGICGPICDSKGKVLGRHNGIENFTVGQRRGIGIAADEALYVTGVDSSTHTVYVGPDPETFRSGLFADELSWTAEAPTGNIDVYARIRHRHRPAAARLSPLGTTRVRIDFVEPQRAVTPGQAVVFYRGDEVIGGGTIQESSPRASMTLQV